jgi:hypothetical protein
VGGIGKRLPQDDGGRRVDRGEVGHGRRGAAEGSGRSFHPSQIAHQLGEFFPPPASSQVVAQLAPQVTRLVG